MNKLKLLIVSISLILASGIASAASVSANATLQSDYTWRGMTQNNGDASINGGLDVEFDSGFYVGTWVAAVGSGAEVDYYGGLAGEMGNISYDIGYIKFDYPAVAGGGSDFEEAYLGLGLGDFGLSFASGQDSATDNIEISYGFGDFGFAYGEYDDVGEYFYLSYGFELGDFAMTVGYTEFEDDASTSTMTADEDAFFLDITLL
ncbi:MAG: hypothetical protein EVA49_02650 [Gammaproteobacteria bacterium]|mgnify:FL=1|nr:MAG: hypothetical protein EVA49_02650 [Gammaproteobacteria bacterium]|tara:strand:- start:36 stop:647 length:612 start_codon:yes stop_codon:yes gene_type:complete